MSPCGPIFHLLSHPNAKRVDHVHLLDVCHLANDHGVAIIVCAQYPVRYGQNVRLPLLLSLTITRILPKGISTCEPELF